MKKLLLIFITSTLLTVSCKKENQIEPISAQKEAYVETIGLGNRFGGGIIFYLDSSQVHGLISSEQDQAENIWWKHNVYGFDGATGTGIGMGKPNTTLLSSNNSFKSDAAIICDTLTLNGYDDWFLPSIDELELLYNKRNIVGGFNYNECYWSSSEINSNSAYKFSFYIGNQKIKEYKYLKNGNVRAIRSF